tara:strand:+ start:133 stop:882 length:750 start_codon:yes stop_codon:yes gene_type:complete
MRLFRKIRRKLVDSGKTKSYLLYALGEILLIVIGILIAWKINSLNDIRKNRIVELKIYETLIEEMDANSKLLDYSIVRYSQNIETIQIIIKSIGLQKQELTEAIKDAIINVNYKPTQLHNGAINSVNSTNKFEFIESVLLKDLIASYPSELDYFEDQEAKINNIITNRLKPAIENHVSLIDILSERDSEFKRVKNLLKQSSYKQLLNSRAYQNALVDRLLQTENQIAIAISLRKKTKTIASKFKVELGS